MFTQRTDYMLIYPIFLHMNMLWGCYSKPNISLLVYLIVLLGCWSQAAIEEVQINVDISLSRAQVGDVVTLYCTVYDMPTDGYIYWFKTVMAGEKGEIFEVVALSDQPMPPYDRFPRLKFSSASSGNTKGYTLKLDGKCTMFCYRMKTWECLIGSFWPMFVHQFMLLFLRCMTPRTMFENTFHWTKSVSCWKWINNWLSKS